MQDHSKLLCKMWLARRGMDTVYTVGSTQQVHINR